MPTRRAFIWSEVFAATRSCAIHRPRRSTQRRAGGSSTGRSSQPPLDQEREVAAGPEVDIKVLATGLAAGILLDATIIRALLVPATVSLFGKWNWYLPDTAAKLLRVKPSHTTEPSATRQLAGQPD
jgi:hypothetical protein